MSCEPQQDIKEPSPLCLVPLCLPVCLANSLYLSILSRPEGSLRPEVILEAVAGPDLELGIAAITRVAIGHQDIETEEKPV